MANITKTNTRKNVVELRTTLMGQGTAMETVYIDGRPFCCLGSVGEADRKAALDTIQTALDSSENVYEAMLKLTQVALISDTGANPTEQIEVEGEQLLIDYDKKTAYNLAGEELVNCKDINCEDKAVIKELLKSRFETKIATEEVKGWQQTYMEKVMGITGNEEDC